MKKKIFTEKQLNISAVLAGPIPPGILIYKNYKAMGKDGHALLAILFTLLFTTGLFYALIEMPQEVFDEIPSYLFASFYGLLVFIFLRYFMEEEIEYALRSGAQKASNWSVAGITVFGLILNLLIIFGFSMNSPYYKTDYIQVEGNELYYEGVDQQEVDILARELTSNGFFSPEFGNIAKLESTEKGYLITLVVDKEMWSDEQFISSMVGFKWFLEVEMGKSIDMRLEYLNLSGNAKYKDI